MTSTTSIVENYLTTDYMNYVVFFNIFFGRSCYPVKRKKLWKNTSIGACVLKGWGFLKMAADSIVGLQKSCYSHGARGLLATLGTFWSDGCLWGRPTSTS
jgi:hypothetical protein